MPRVVIVALAVFVTIYALVDVLMTNGSRIRVLPKAVWLLVCLVPVLGPMVWFVAGRTDRGTGGVLPDRGRRGGPRPSAPRGPDDDPDFLRTFGRPKKP